MILTRTERIDLFVKLGEELAQKNSRYRKVRNEAFLHNPWFTETNIDRSVDSICNYFLQKDLLEAWVKQYTHVQNSLNVGLILAGNIPLVGFHDFLSVIISGHHAIIKLSSKDEKLFRYILALMLEIEPRVEKCFTVVERLKEFDAVIATGSNNSSRYFEYYFGKYPNIIRKNRNGTAVLTGDESESDLRDLSNDVFDYFGLGCRNITKLYLPMEYSIEKLISILDQYEGIEDHHKYRNNYDYNYALYLLNKDKFLAGKNILLIEETSYLSRIACLHYEYYENMEDLKKAIDGDLDLIQCVCSISGKTLDLDVEVRFGEAQRPGLTEYADGVDTMKFLSEL